MSVVSVVTNDNFTVSMVGVGLIGVSAIGGLLVNYAGCRTTAKSIHETETSKNKHGKVYKAAQRAMYRFSAPIYAMLMFVLSSLITLTMYIFRATGFLTVATDGGDFVDVNTWIAISTGAALYMLGARWILDSKWPQVIISALAALGSPLLFMAAELLHAEILFLRILLIVLSGLLAIVAIVATAWPLNFIFKSRGTEKARKGSMRINYLTLGVLMYMGMWFMGIFSSVFDLEWIGYFTRGLFVMIELVFLHFIFLVFFISYLFRKADEHAKTGFAHARV